MNLTVQININTGVESISVNGTKYTSSQKIYIKEGTNVTWTSTAKSGYAMNTVSGTINNIQESATISPTATKLSVIKPSDKPTVSGKCLYASPSLSTCHWTKLEDKVKYLCDQTCGGYRNSTTI